MRSRSGERGAIAVEAAIVIVLISGILSGALWIFCGYEAKLGATHEARAEVWTTAMGGASCGEGDDSLSPLDRSLARARQVARGASLTRSLSSSLSITSTTRTRRSRGTGASLRPSTTATALCKELPADVSPGDIKDTIDSLYDDLL